ncbi:MAG: anti-CBASS protein Acb1 family protein [Intestinimonas sp.]
MCLDLSGASRIPVTKLFGRSPAGMNATGESDLRNYYDYVDTLREAKLRPILEKLLPVPGHVSLGGGTRRAGHHFLAPVDSHGGRGGGDRAEKGPGHPGYLSGGPVPGGHGSEGAQEAGGRDRDV